MKRTTAFSVCIAAATLAAGFATAQTAAPSAPANAVQSSTAASPQKLDAIRTILILKTSLTSKNAPAGKPVKAVLKQSVSLPGGEVLPKETPLLGTVLASNKHSKEKPNGTLILEFHEAAVKGHDPVQLIVRLKGLAPSIESEDASTTLPNSNGNMVSLAGNSGGGAQIASQLNDRSNLTGKQPEASSIEGVHLLPSAQGAGAIFSLGEDVYLDEDVQMTVLIAPVPEKSK
jgi:hypothetical protein